MPPVAFLTGILFASFKASSGNTVGTESVLLNRLLHAAGSMSLGSPSPLGSNAYWTVTLAILGS